MVALVDSDVQCRLTPFVSGVNIGTAGGPASHQQVYDRRFISKGSVMNSAVAILVFYFEITVISERIKIRNLRLTLFVNNFENGSSRNI